MKEIQEYVSADNIKYLLANLKQLTFEVTDACNLKCKYCGYGEFYNDYDNRENKMINLNASLKLFDYLAEYWNSEYNTSANQNTYISFYGGEPLLNMRFIKSIVSYIKTRDFPHREFTFSMTTNAILLHRYMDYLSEHQFGLLISLDGNEYNTSYRVDKTGKSAFQRIIKNVDALYKKYPDYFENKVNFNAVLHNKNSVEEIYRFINERYNKIPSIGELNSMGIRADKIALFKKTYRNTSESLHQSENYEAIEHAMFLKTGSYNNLTRFLHNHSGFVYRDYTDLLFEQPSKRIPTGTCLPFGKRMFVTVNGKILPCERIGHQFALGTVSEAGVKLDLQAIADRYNGYYAKLDSQCSKCHNVKTCIQCLYNLDDLDNKPVCYGFMNKQEYENSETNQMIFLRKHPEDYYRIMENVIVE